MFVFYLIAILIVVLCASVIGWIFVLDENPWIAAVLIPVILIFLAGIMIYPEWRQCNTHLALGDTGLWCEGYGLALFLLGPIAVISIVIFWVVLYAMNRYYLKQKFDEDLPRQMPNL